MYIILFSAWNFVIFKLFGWIKFTFPQKIFAFCLSKIQKEIFANTKSVQIKDWIYEVTFLVYTHKNGYYKHFSFDDEKVKLIK